LVAVSVAVEEEDLGVVQVVEVALEVEEAVEVLEEAVPQEDGNASRNTCSHQK